MTENQYTVILFHSSGYAVRTEKLLLKAGIPCKMMPVPRHLSSDCGVCARILQVNRDAALAVLEAVKLPVVAIHDLES